MWHMKKDVMPWIYWNMLIRWGKIWYLVWMLWTQHQWPKCRSLLCEALNFCVWILGGGNMVLAFCPKTVKLRRVGSSWACKQHSDNAILYRNFQITLKRKSAFTYWVCVGIQKLKGYWVLFSMPSFHKKYWIIASLIACALYDQGGSLFCKPYYSTL